MTLENLQEYGYIFLLFPDVFKEILENKKEISDQKSILCQE